MTDPNASLGSSILWLREWREQTGGPGFRIGREGQDTLVAEWDGVGRLSASRSGAEHSLTLAEHLSEAHRDKLTNGVVRALLLHLKGAVTLHGAAVALRGGALVFVGRSGAGKSTMAACVCARFGARLLADDVVTLERRAENYFIVPSATSHWLFPDSSEALGFPAADQSHAKLPFAAVGRRDPSDIAGVPLRALVALRFDDEVAQPQLTSAEGLASFNVINEGFIRFVVDSPEVALRDLDQISALSANVPTLQLVHRGSLADLTLVAEVVGRHCDKWSAMDLRHGA